MANTYRTPAGQGNTLHVIMQVNLHDLLFVVWPETCGGYSNFKVGSLKDSSGACSTFLRVLWSTRLPLASFAPGQLCLYQLRLMYMIFSHQ
jgi:hypothetical protein